MLNSAAAPIWAGMVGQVNAALIAQNKPPMGFINPWLYGAGLSAMNDITVGASVGCNGKSGFGETLPPELGAKVLYLPYSLIHGRFLAHYMDHSNIVNR